MCFISLCFAILAPILCGIVHLVTLALKGIIEIHFYSFFFIVPANITGREQLHREVRFFTTQCSSSALQGDLPGEGVSSGLLCLQLLLGARKHVPPKQQHLGKVIAHKGGAWAQT